MAKDKGKSGQGGDLTNQHKRMAMGSEVTGMKKGGSVKPADKPVKNKAKETMKITTKKGK